MSEVRYRVIFQGEISPGCNIEQVKRGLAVLYKTDVTKIERHFFSGGRKIIKDNVNERTAQKLKQAIERTGAKCTIEQIKNSVIKKAAETEKIKKENSSNKLTNTSSEIKKRTPKIKRTPALGSTTAHPNTNSQMFEYANPLQRFLAVVIDIIIVLPLFGAFIVPNLLNLLLKLNMDFIAKQKDIDLIIVLFAGWLYYSIMEYSPLQGTIGKIFVGIKVVDLSGKRLSLVKIIIRSSIRMLYFINEIFWVLAFIGFITMVLINKKAQTLHDFPIRSFVIKQKRERLRQTMKIAFAVVLLLIIVFVFTIIMLPSFREQVCWLGVSFVNVASGYDWYLGTFPKARYIHEAKELREIAMQEETKQKDRESWRNALKTNTIQSYEEYMRLYPEGKHIEHAQENIEKIVWKQVTQKNTLIAYQNYLNSYPKGRFVTQAKELLDPFIWQKTKKENTLIAYKDYLEKYPTGQFSSQAKDKFEELLWQQIETENTIEAYQRYRDLYSTGGSFSSLAEENIIWLQAIEDDTEIVYQNYLKTYPEGQFVKQAKERLDPFVWQQVIDDNTEIAYQKYLEAYPEGQFVEQAKEKLELFVWQKTVKEHTIESLERYIENYPEGKYVDKAKRRISILEAELKGSSTSSRTQATQYPKTVNTTHFTFRFRGCGFALNPFPNQLHCSFIVSNNSNKTLSISVFTSSTMSESLYSDGSFSSLQQASGIQLSRGLRSRDSQTATIPPGSYEEVTLIFEYGDHKKEYRKFNIIYSTNLSTNRSTARLGGHSRY